MGQDTSQVSGQTEAAGLIRAGSIPEGRGRGFDTALPVPSVESRSPSKCRAPMLGLKESEAKC